MFQSVDDLVEALGGSTKAAQVLGVRVTAVSNWRTKKKIPAGWYPKLALMLPGRVPTGLFTFRPEPSEIAEAAEPAA